MRQVAIRYETPSFILKGAQGLSCEMNTDIVPYLCEGSTFYSVTDGKNVRAYSYWNMERIIKHLKMTIMKRMSFFVSFPLWNFC